MKRLPAFVFIHVTGVPSIPLSVDPSSLTPKAKRTASSRVTLTALQAPPEGCSLSLRQGPPQGKGTTPTPSTVGSDC